MSDKNKEKKLPGKDYFHKTGKKDEKKRKPAVATQQERAEFEAAFSDGENEEVRTYVPGKKDRIDKTMPFRKLKENEKGISRELEESAEDSLSGTRHFNLRSKNKKPSSEKPRKNLMQDFRVLSKNREDRTILEAAPVGEGGSGFVDSVTANQGEDFFDAVERVYTSKTEEKNKNNKKSRLEYRQENGKRDGEKLLKKLIEENAKLEKLMLAYLILFAVSLILTLFFSRSSFYGALSLVLCAVSCVLSYPAFVKSFKAIKGYTAVADTSLVIMSFFALLHNICALVLGQTGGVYTLCVIFACLAGLLAKHYDIKSRTRLIKTLLGNKGLLTLQRAGIKNEAAGHSDKLKKESDIFFCVRAMLDTSLKEPETDRTRENKYYVFTMSFVLLSAIVVGLFSFTTQSSGLSFITALTAALCTLLPVMYSPLSRVSFFYKGEKMLRHGAVISGKDAISRIGRSDGFVLEAADVFSGEVSRFRKSASSDMDQNDSAIFAALLLRESGSVLAPCFDAFLEQMNIIIPPVENFIYEERLGYSAWVLDRKVLVGNRQMLVNHSIADVPTAEQEKAYGKDRDVMYVVINGEITATFLVSYKVLSSIKKYSRAFNKTGLVLMLSTKEIFLDEIKIAERLHIDVSSVKILSSKSVTTIEKYNSRYDRQIPSGLFCSGKKRSLVHLIMGCYEANAADRQLLIMLLLGQLLGFLLLVLSAVLDMTLFFNPVVIILIRALWSFAAVYLVSKRKI